MATDIRTYENRIEDGIQAAWEESLGVTDENMFFYYVSNIEESLEQVNRIIEDKEVPRLLIENKVRISTYKMLDLMIKYFDPHANNPQEVYGVDLSALSRKTIKVLQKIDPKNVGRFWKSPEKDIQDCIAMLEKECEFIESGGTVEMRRMKDSKYPYIRESGQNWIDTVAVPPPVTPTLAYEI